MAETAERLSTTAALRAKESHVFLAIEGRYFIAFVDLDNLEVAMVDAFERIGIISAPALDEMLNGLPDFFCFRYGIHNLFFYERSTASSATAMASISIKASGEYRDETSTMVSAG